MTDSIVFLFAPVEDFRGGTPVGAGTVLTARDVDACLDVGVDFIVTPGVTPTLSDALLKCSVPVCPGVSTPGEAMTLYERGFEFQKFFPAGASGGARFLKALAGPLRSVSFMPTGGVTTENMNDYLELPTVFAVGGSWIAPAEVLNKSAFGDITENMRQALVLAEKK